MDITQGDALRDALKGKFAVLSAAPYHATRLIAEAAKAAGAHYLDLTEDVASTRVVKQLAQGANTAFIPQCGLAPGFITIVASDLASRFDELHASEKPQLVLMYINSEATVDAIMPNPLVIVASDGGPGHPRNAGTYAKVLSRYVRDLRTISLMDAIRKMSLLPAQMLEQSTLAGRRKGRLQEGADADIVVFDAAAISDRATFEKPMEPSVGVRYLVVGGTVLVDEGRIIPDVFPGRALLGPGRTSSEK